MYADCINEIDADYQICPYCDEDIPADCSVCPECGSYLDESHYDRDNEDRWNCNIDEDLI